MSYRNHILNFDYQDQQIHPYHEIEDLILNYLDPIKTFQSLIPVNKYYHELITHRDMYIKLKSCCNSKNQHTEAILPMYKKEKIFYHACIFGYLDIVEYLYQMYHNKINIHIYDDIIYRHSCEYGQLEIVKFLLQTVKNINIYTQGSYGFQKSCQNNHTELTKFLYQYSLEHSKNGHTRDYTFYYLCTHEYYDIAQWIYSLPEPVDKHFINCDYYELVTCCCKSNKLDIVQWIYSIKKDFYVGNRMSNNYFFRLACQFSDLSIIKWLYDTIATQIDIDAKNEFLFWKEYNPCHMEKIEFLFSTCDRLNIDINYPLTFRACYKTGNLEVVKWFYQFALDRNNKINIHYHNDRAFRYCCENNHFDIAQWIYQISLDDDNVIDVSIDDECAFINSCWHGKFKIAKSLYKISLANNKPIDIYTNNNRAFLLSCRGGHIKIAKWLYQISLDNNNRFHLNDNRAFRLSCFNGHLEIAKWLYQISLDNNNPIDIRKNDDHIFKKSHQNGHTEICQWLSTLCDRYVVTIIPHDMIHATFYEKN